MHPIDVPLWLEREEIAGEERAAFIAENDLTEDWQPDPEDLETWWFSSEP